MIQFTDKNGATVRLSFSDDTFQHEPNHVLVICQYRNKWLLTKHKKRGIEFPGGKREVGETIEDAARREVLEETGAKLNNLRQIGAYEVVDEQSTFTKAIFYAQVDVLTEQNHYFETSGPVLVSHEDLLSERLNENYSFIMKDKVIEQSLQYIEKIIGN